jgi:hypothetical protein
MDRKYLSAPFDMSEYIFGKRFVLGGVDFDLDDKKEDEKTPTKKEKKEERPEPVARTENR